MKALDPEKIKAMFESWGCKVQDIPQDKAEEHLALFETVRINAEAAEDRKPTATQKKSQAAIAKHYKSPEKPKTDKPKADKAKPKAEKKAAAKSENEAERKPDKDGPAKRSKKSKAKQESDLDRKAPPGEGLLS